MGRTTSYDPPFTEYDALRVIPTGEGSYDYTVNLDNSYLLTELGKAKDPDKELLVHWFKYGLAISAMGMIQHTRKTTTTNGSKADSSADALDLVNTGMNGLASVIVPIIRSLHRPPA